MNIMQFARICVVGLAAIGIIGCGSNETRLVDVSGIVTLDGEPLAGAEIHFINGSIEGYGRTDENGRFQLVNGAAPGQNKVYIKEFAMPGMGNAGVPGDLPPAIQEDEAQVQALLEAQGKKPGRGGSPQSQSGSKIPAEYSDPEATKLTFSVPDGGSESANFKLIGR